MSLLSEGYSVIGETMKDSLTALIILIIIFFLAWFLLKEKMIK